MDCFDVKEVTRDNFMEIFNEVIVADIVNRTGVSTDIAMKLIVPYRFFCDCQKYVPKKFTLLYNVPSDEELESSLVDLESVFGALSETLKRLFFKEFLGFDDKYIGVLQTYDFSDFELSILYSVSLFSLLGTDIILKVGFNFRLRDLLKALQDRLRAFLAARDINTGTILPPMSGMLEELKAATVGYKVGSKEYDRFMSLFVEFYFIALNDGLNNSDARDYAVAETIKSAMFSTSSKVSSDTFNSINININPNSSREYIGRKFNELS